MREIYATGRQFITVQSLKKPIERNWVSLKQEFLQTFILSLPNRVLEMIRKNSLKT